jgi:hypothetical protein
MGGTSTSGSREHSPADGYTGCGMRRNRGDDAEASESLTGNPQTIYAPLSTNNGCATSPRLRRHQKASRRWACALVAVLLHTERGLCDREDEMSVPSQLITPKGYMVPQGVPLGLAGQDMAGGLEVILDTL